MEDEGIITQKDSNFVGCMMLYDYLILSPLWLVLYQCSFNVFNGDMFFFSSANEGARLNQKIKNKFGTREGVNFLSVYSVSPEAVGRWPGGYKATV